MTQKKPTPRRDGARAGLPKAGGPRVGGARTAAGGKTTGHTAHARQVRIAAAQLKTARDARAKGPRRSRDERTGATRGRQTAQHSVRDSMAHAKVSLGPLSGTAATPRLPSGPRRAALPAGSRPSVRSGTASPLDESVSIPLPEGEHLTCTRRQLIIGAAAVGAAAAGIGVAAVMGGGAKEDDVATLQVSEDAVLLLSDIGEEGVLDAQSVMRPAGEYRLPYGTLLWAAPGSACAACLLPTETATPLTQIGILSLSDGSCDTVLAAPASAEPGYDIYEARADDTGLVWTEANCMSGQWRVYHAARNGASIGTPVLADEGGDSYEIPSIAVAGGRAFWQVLPDADGPASAEDSLLKSAAFGQGDVREMWRSTGRMSTPPYSTGDGVVITPRVDASGVYHQLTLLDAASGQMLDALTLPASMKPLEAGYVDGRFTFSFEGSYAYGGGIARIGTYAPVDAGGASGDSWFCFDRAPSAAPAWAGRFLIVKSTRSVSGVDAASREMFSLECPDGCDDFGEYLATTGTASTIVTYVSMPAADGEDEGHTLVRVWDYAE